MGEITHGADLAVGPVDGAVAELKPAIVPGDRMRSRGDGGEIVGGHGSSGLQPLLGVRDEVAEGEHSEALRGNQRQSEATRGSRYSVCATRLPRGSATLPIGSSPSKVMRVDRSSPHSSPLASCAELTISCLAALS